MKNHPLPDPKILREYLNYCPITGVVTWKKKLSKKVVVGTVAGSPYAKSLGIGFMGTRYYLHRIIWRMVTGEDPGDMQIDHRDVNSHNNKWDNLRLASGSQNGMNVKRKPNNTSGVKGVSYFKLSNKWRAYLDINGKFQHLGLFRQKEDAEAAVKAEREKLHGEFVNHG